MTSQIQKLNAAQIAQGAERHEHVLRLRSSGWTFRRIATELGISPSRAAQIYNRAVKLQREHSPVHVDEIAPDTPIDLLPLSVRTSAALKAAGYTTWAQLMPLDNAMERLLLALPNFGRPCFNELIALLSETGSDLH